jgi:hypothetical protein
MPEVRDELAQAVTEVLAWMESTPEAAGAALGINARTLTAMTQGLPPMRSLVIRFAEGVRRRCEQAEGAPAAWRDIDAWLNLAGYPPRRENAAPGPRPPGEGVDRRPPQRPAFQPPRPAPPPEAADGPPASQYYRPIYERQAWGDTFLHVFWVVNPQNERVFQRTMRADYDYKAEAVRLKQDLAKLSRQQFERKYGRFRK